ncbi:hypothetical protein EYF80_030401 [Liparis tanakae]|uniref:Uncharacterized protein n=1 Tax=Liparis tanakae TaxID=230148 RepID=A0A4Z2H0V7_9TELE|nr:hypothetical protein EYF80_030401 [Liparis tanakae]
MHDPDQNQTRPRSTEADESTCGAVLRGVLECIVKSFLKELPFLVSSRSLVALGLQQCVPATDLLASPVLHVQPVELLFLAAAVLAQGDPAHHLLALHGAPVVDGDQQRDVRQLEQRHLEDEGLLVDGVGLAAANRRLTARDLLAHRVQQGQAAIDSRPRKEKLTLRLLRASSTSVVSTAGPPSGSSEPNRSTFSPIIFSRDIRDVPSAYSRNRTADACRSAGSRREKRKVSLKSGSVPFCTAVRWRCFLPGSSTMCTCHESMPLRALSGTSRAEITETSSFSVSARYSRERTRSPHLEMGSRGDGDSRKSPGIDPPSRTKRIRSLLQNPAHLLEHQVTERLQYLGCPGGGAVRGDVVSVAVLRGLLRLHLLAAVRHLPFGAGGGALRGARRPESRGSVQRDRRRLLAVLHGGGQRVLEPPPDALGLHSCRWKVGGRLHICGGEGHHIYTSN